MIRVSLSPRIALASIVVSSLLLVGCSATSANFRFSPLSPETRQHSLERLEIKANDLPACSGNLPLFCPVGRRCYCGPQGPHENIGYFLLLPDSAQRTALE